jgi:hypothetical protein
MCTCMYVCTYIRSILPMRCTLRNVDDGVCVCLCVHTLDDRMYVYVCVYILCKCDVLIRYVDDDVYMRVYVYVCTFIMLCMAYVYFVI